MRQASGKRRVLYFFYLLIIVFLLLEVLLRIYNPFHFRIKGDKILLQANRETIIHNNSIPGIDSLIIHRKNGLGLRGPERPPDFNDRLSIITVGGSTTECSYISEGKTWSNHLEKNLADSFSKIWLNNAGLAGHSTFGHSILLQDYLVKLKPSVVLFLVGCNDMLLDSLRPSDKSNLKGYAPNIFTYLSKHSEVCNLLVNLWRTRKITTNKLDDTYFDPVLHRSDSFVIPQIVIDQKLDIARKYLPAYEARLQLLVDICKANGIRPVLITQPSMYGEGIDDITGLNLELVKHNESTNGGLWWKQLQLYNNSTRRVAEKNNVFLIDLATALPKGSKYFYDYVHFNHIGNQEVGTLIAARLGTYLSKEFPKRK